MISMYINLASLAKHANATVFFFTANLSEIPFLCMDVRRILGCWVNSHKSNCDRTSTKITMEQVTMFSGYINYK